MNKDIVVLEKTIPDHANVVVVGGHNTFRTGLMYILALQTILSRRSKTIEMVIQSSEQSIDDTLMCLYRTLLIMGFVHGVSDTKAKRFRKENKQNSLYRPKSFIVKLVYKWFKKRNCTLRIKYSFDSENVVDTVKLSAVGDITNFTTGSVNLKSLNYRDYDLTDVNVEIKEKADIVIGTKYDRNKRELTYEVLKHQEIVNHCIKKSLPDVDRFLNSY